MVSPVNAVLLGVVLVFLLAAGVVLDVLTHNIHYSTNAIIALGLGAVGLVVALRQPRNPIGWLVLATGVLVTLGNDAKLYSLLDYRMHDGALPLGLAAVFVAGGLSTAALVVAPPAILLFPDGRLPSVRWRWVTRSYLVLSFLLVGGQVITEFAIIGQRIHVDALGNATSNPTGVVADFGFSYLLIVALIPIWFSWAVHQVRNYRHSSGERRQQLKWVSAGAATALVSLVTGVFLSDNYGGLGQIVWQLTRLGIAVFPLTIGVAMLKYRLYEIDRIISRTLSYAVVTGLVVGVYVGIVTLTTKALGFHTPVAVAASTLAAVALFSPLRQRVQRVVDHRFNRARYDADATVAAFTARLRDAVDLETVRSELLEVVNRAVEPVHASVWIRRRE